MKNKNILIIGGSGEFANSIINTLKIDNKIIVASSKFKGLNSFDTDLNYHHLDLSNQHSIQSFFEHLKNHNIFLDIVIFNSSINSFNPLIEESEHTIHTIININIQGCILVNKYSIPLLNKNGVICNISSVFGSIGFPYFSVYSASKSAIKTFSEALNREIQHTGKNVLYFQPRAIHTNMNSEHVISMNKELKSSVDQPNKVVTQLIKHIEKRKSGIPFYPEKIFSIINSLFPFIIDNDFKKKINIIQKYWRNTK